MSAMTLHRRILAVAVLVASGMSWGCRPAAESEPAAPADSEPTAPQRQTAIRFADVAAAWGVDFIPRNGCEAGHRAILETLGAGVAVFDYDADGNLDLFLPGGGAFSDEPQPVGLPPRLYRNGRSPQSDDGKHTRTFTDVTAAADLAGAPFYSHGAFVADYDADGLSDLLMTGYGGLALYRNLGDGTFDDVATSAGLDPLPWSSGAAWADLDADGMLDLYLNNYVDWSFENHPVCLRGGLPDVCAPAEFHALDDALYRSRGDGTFALVSRESGLVPGGKGLSVLAADIDEDGDIDLYVANDTTPNFLYWNDGRGRLSETGLVSGTALDDAATPNGSMGVDFADLDGDGRCDLWVANFEDESFALYRNMGAGLFQHASYRAGITAVGRVYVGFGTAACDFDGDGDEDIFVANGHVMGHPANAPVRQRPLVFENLGGMKFINVADQAGAYANSPHMARGVATGDLDGDGDVDVVVTHINEPVSVLENRSTAGGRSIGLRLIGTASNRSAIGARVRLETTAGVQVRHVKGGASYLSTSDRRVVFAVPPGAEPRRIEIRWPSGAATQWDDVAVDTEMIVVEGGSRYTAD